MPNNNLNAFLKDFAKESFDCGQPMSTDDFSEFKQLCAESGFSVTEDDFDTYFRFFEEVQSQCN